MKIKVKDLADLKAQLASKLAGYKAKGKSDDVAKTLVESWIEENEFEAEDGATLEISLADLETKSAGDNADAIGNAVAKAIEPLLKDLNRQGNGASTRVHNVTISDPVERMFCDEKDPEFRNWGFKNLGEFGVAIFNHQAKNHTDTRLGNVIKAYNAIRGGQWKAAPTTYASELVGADGGFLVPPEYRKEVWVAIHGQSEFLQRIDLTPTSSNTVNLNVDQNAPWDNSSGVQTYWRQQATSMSQSKPILQNRQVTLNELYALVPATDELLSDAPMLNNYLGVKAPEKMTWQIDEAIVRGTGQGQPLGFEQSKATQAITATYATASGFVFADLIAMVPHLLPPVNNFNELAPATWVFGPRSYAYGATLGTTSNAGFPLFLSGHNAESRIAQLLLGYPIHVSQHAKGFDQQGDIGLYNFKGYMGFNRQDGFDFESSIHLYFDAGATALRWRYRFGGEPMLRSTITSPNDTGNALSHCIVLGARA